MEQQEKEKNLAQNKAEILNALAQHFFDECRKHNLTLSEVNDVAVKIYDELEARRNFAFYRIPF